MALEFGCILKVHQWADELWALFSQDEVVDLAGHFIDPHQRPLWHDEHMILIIPHLRYVDVVQVHF